MKRSLLVTLAAACAAALPAAALADVPLGAGKVVVKKYPGGVTVHAFMTQDAMNDVASLIETRRGLVAVEAPAFRSDIAAWKGYIRSLRKPVRAVLLSNHPSNGGWYGNAPVYSTASAKAAMASGSTRAIVEGVKRGFGDKFESELATVDRILPIGRTRFDGVAYDIRQDGDGYAVVLPAQKIAFRHMLGGDSHSIIGSPAQADSMISQLSRYRREGIRAVYSTHHAPEGADAIRQKISYLRTLKDVAARSAGKEEFVAAMKAKYPRLQGDKYLGMTAGRLYRAK